MLHSEIRSELTPLLSQICGQALQELFRQQISIPRVECNFLEITALYTNELNISPFFALYKKLNLFTVDQFGNPE